jgi:hypothetical protein
VNLWLCQKVKRTLPPAKLQTHLDGWQILMGQVLVFYFGTMRPSRTNLVFDNRINSLQREIAPMLADVVHSPLQHHTHRLRLVRSSDPAQSNTFTDSVSSVRHDRAPGPLVHTCALRLEFYLAGIGCFHCGWAAETKMERHREAGTHPAQAWACERSRM